jgi:hypothetical protein
MRKFGFVAAAALILTGFGGWVASTPRASVATPIGVQVDPLQIMMNTKGFADGTVSRLFRGVRLNGRLVVTASDARTQ